jgi:alpha-1,2-mannosyltransferase
LRRVEPLVFELREAHWLDADRVLSWARVLAVMSVLGALALVILTHGGGAPDPWQRPLAPDFVSFWTAARLAVGGIPEAAWNPVAQAAAERANFVPVLGYASDYYAFFYPPPFLLICLPFAPLPYGLAVVVWLAMTGVACFAVVRALLPRRWPTVLVFLAFPALWINAWNGQNGALSAALLGAATLQMDRRPRIAGACLGTLCFKPQLALLVVPALIAARRFQVLLWAAMTVGALCLVSLLVFGEAAWQGFLSATPLARAAMEFGWVGFAKMVSTFAAVRLLGVSSADAWVAQGAVAVAVFIVTLLVVRQRPGARAEGAILATGACLMTPFVLDYDLMLLAIPLAWVVARAEQTCYLPWEKLVLASAFLLPMVARSLATWAGVSVAPLVLMALLGVVVRRAWPVPVVSRCIA